MKGSLFRLAVFTFALATLFTMFSPSATAADKPPADSLAWAWAVADRGSPAPAKPAPSVSANKCDVCGPACACPSGACASGNCPTSGVVTIEGKPYTFANGYYWPLGDAPVSAQNSEPRKPKFFNKDGSVCVECEAAETAYLARQAAKAGTVSPVSFVSGSPCASGNCGVSQGGFTYAAGSSCATGNCGTATGFGSSQLTTVQGFGSQGRSGGFFANVREARAERKAARSGGCAVCK